MMNLHNVVLLKNIPRTDYQVGEYEYSDQNEKQLATMHDLSQIAKHIMRFVGYSSRHRCLRRRSNVIIFIIGIKQRTIVQHHNK